jgi:hypothetical protein
VGAVVDDVKAGEPEVTGFICCPECGKRLIRKTKSGRFHFIFGKFRGESPPVEIYIEGEIRMKCLRHRSCNAWITIKN